MNATGGAPPRTPRAPDEPLGRPWREADGTIRASACIAAGSPWFDGHFPGEPILPGVAMLALVCDTLSAATADRLRLAGLRRVRFKQVVRPDDRLEIIVSPKAGGEAAFAFRVQVADSVVCSGTLDMV